MELKSYLKCKLATCQLWWLRFRTHHRKKCDWRSSAHKQEGDLLYLDANKAGGGAVYLLILKALYLLLCAQLLYCKRFLSTNVIPDKWKLSYGTPILSAIAKRFNLLVYRTI
jgi:hypothetical protein